MLLTSIPNIIENEVLSPERYGIYMIRFILTALFVILFLILSTPLLLIEWVIGKYNPDLKARSSLAVVKWAFRIITFLSGAKPVFIGLENIPKDQAVLFVGNHRSFFDVVLTYQKVNGLCGYIAKKEMEKIPLLNSWMCNLHCLFLDRENIKAGLTTILEAIKKAKSGISICIFPEGTRGKIEGEFLPFHDGSFKVAAKANIPVVPMTILNSAEVFENHLPWMKKAKVIIEYGKPINLKELSPEDQKQIGAYVQNIIKETYQKNLPML